MATISSITLSGGVKAPDRFDFGLEARSAPMDSRMFVAFSGLVGCLAEVARAEERLKQPQSWDLAMQDVTSMDAGALEAAGEIAREIAAMQRQVASDHGLAAAAHFIAHGLGLEQAEDRATLLAALQGARPIFTRYAPGLTARRTADLITAAISRLATVFDVLNHTSVVLCDSHGMADISFEQLEAAFS